jgi:hypothetical protein
MPKKKRRDTPEKQRSRFLQTAKELDTDMTGKAFERAMGILAPPVKPQRRKAK